jgi:hypothetical protein
MDMGYYHYWGYHLVLNLSSWMLKREPLSTWLIEELRVKYGVSTPLGQFWVEIDQLFLLDGPF